MTNDQTKRVNGPTLSESNFAKIGVVIVNWNSFPLLKQCIDALDRQSYAIWKLIVVDNGSQQIPIALPKLKRSDTEYIWLSSNTGFAYANNIAIQRLNDCDWIALVNPDAFPTPDWLKNLIVAAKNHPNGACFAGPTLMANNPLILDGAGDVYHISGLPWRSQHGRSKEYAPTLSKRIFSTCAAAALYKRSALEEAGGFDEDFFCYSEDVDLGFRLNLQGYCAFFVPSAPALHVGSGTCGGSHTDSALYYGHRNVVWTYIKNMPSPLFELLLPLHIVMSVVVCLYFAAKGKGATLLSAKIDAVKGIPLMWKKRKEIQKMRQVSIIKLWSLLDKSITGRGRRKNLALSRPQTDIKSQQL